MKSSTKKAILILLFMLIVNISNFFIPVLFEHYRYLIYLVLCGIIVNYLIGISVDTSINRQKILKNMSIYLMLYFFISFLSGLFIGFNKTIYSYTLSNLVKNVLPTITIIVVSEVLRYQFIKKTNNDKRVIALSFLVFLLLDISIGFYNYNLSVQSEIYEFIGLAILGGISRNIFMTVLDIKVDYFVPIVYRLIMELYIFLVPIVPAFGPYINSVILIVFPILLSFMVFKELKPAKVEKPSLIKKQGKKNIIFYVVTGILIILVLLNSGFMKYQTLVIGSNSMYPYMARGDVILIEKKKGEEINKLEVGDILVFRYDGKIIAHRIQKVIEKKSGNYFVTKGDNNNQPDSSVISEEKVIGIVKKRAKKIGIPSIWVSELFR